LLSIQGCSSTKIGVGTPFPPHHTSDLGLGRTLTPNITQVPSSRKTTKTHETAVFLSKTDQPVI